MPRYCLAVDSSPSRLRSVETVVASTSSLSKPRLVARGWFPPVPNRRRHTNSRSPSPPHPTAGQSCFPLTKWFCQIRMRNFPHLLPRLRIRSHFWSAQISRRTRATSLITPVTCPPAIYPAVQPLETEQGATVGVRPGVIPVTVAIRCRSTQSRLEKWDNKGPCY